MTLERELKFMMPFGRPIAELEGPDSSVVQLTATYYDTADFRLAGLGATLRFRDNEGWVVKLPVETGGSLISRREIFFDGEADELPDEAAALVSTISRSAELGPVATLTSERRSVALDIGELVDDVVVAHGADGTVLIEFREVELELNAEVSESDAASVLAKLRESEEG